MSEIGLSEAGTRVFMKDKTQSPQPPSVALTASTSATARGLACSNVGCGNVALPSEMKFNCPKCRWDYSLGIGINRGNQTWCPGCNNSYVQLANRWQRNKTLRDRWSHMKADMQCAWFRKWLTLVAKMR